MFNLDDPMPFYKTVWEIVRQVPTRTVTTFGQIATMIPTPDGVDADDYAKLGPRWVGDIARGGPAPQQVQRLL